VQSIVYNKSKDPPEDPPDDNQPIHNSSNTDNHIIQEKNDRFLHPTDINAIMNLIPQDLNDYVSSLITENHTVMPFLSKSQKYCPDGDIIFCTMIASDTNKRTQIKHQFQWGGLKFTQKSTQINTNNDILGLQTSGTSQKLWCYTYKCNGVLKCKQNGCNYMTRLPSNNNHKSGKQPLNMKVGLKLCQTNNNEKTTKDIYRFDYISCSSDTQWTVVPTLIKGMFCIIIHSGTHNHPPPPLCHPKKLRGTYQNLKGQCAAQCPIKKDDVRIFEILKGQCAAHCAHIINNGGVIVEMKRQIKENPQHDK
jgi:hypothetical protein